MTKREFAERYEILLDHIREWYVSASDVIGSIYKTEEALLRGEVNEIRDFLERYIVNASDEWDAAEAKMILEALNENNIYD